MRRLLMVLGFEPLLRKIILTIAIFARGCGLDAGAIAVSASA